VENSEPAAISLSFGRVMAIVLLPFACGYFFSYFFRVVNAVVAPDLIAEIGLNAMQPGLLSAVCFFTFAAFQIPLGVLLEHFGPRRAQGTLYFI
jgi:sugar phosphate permease